MSDLRSILHSAYAFVRSVESNKAASALTLDHMIQEQIDTLKKGETRGILDARGGVLEKRASKWDQLDSLEKSLDAAVQAMQDAGDDPEKLKQLGIFEVDQESRSEDEPSTGVEELG